MTSTSPAFGLLLDVDGPIASPATRKISIPSIATDLAALANAGIPIAFNTGRSLDFVAKQVLAPLTEAGLGAAARVHTIAEKGGAWASVHPTGYGPAHFDPAITLDPRFGAAMRDIVTRRYSETMFFDETKSTMVSIEAFTGVAPDVFRQVQSQIVAHAREQLSQLGYGVTMLGQRYPNAHDETHIRIDPHIIGIDVERIETGKDLGASRALQLFAEDGPIPHTWYTVGDAPSDYAMADWLYAQGYAVTHVDVRATDHSPNKPYPVRTFPTLVNDAAAAVFFHELATSTSPVDGVTGQKP